MARPLTIESTNDYARWRVYVDRELATWRYVCIGAGVAVTVTAILLGDIDDPDYPGKLVATLAWAGVGLAYYFRRKHLEDGLHAAYHRFLERFPKGEERFEMVSTAEHAYRSLKRELGEHN